MGLLELVKHEKEMRKIFGQQELKIIEKQLLGINLSASEKTRLSRDIRPKFEIVKKLSDFKKEFNLKKAQEIKYLINEAKEVILESVWYKQINKIIVFGSTVENQRTFRSDIDIAVEFSDITLREATKFRIHVAGRVNSKIDIQVYNILPKKIKDSIIKNHKILYRK